MHWPIATKSKFNFKIKYADGSVIDMHDKELWVEEFRLSSTSATYETSKVEGVDGEINHGASINRRSAYAVIQINGYDPEDFDMYRDEVFNILRPGEEFEIIRDLQKGKKMKCAVESDFDIDYETCEDGRFVVEFVMFNPYLMSIATTADLDKNGLRYSDELWSYGMGLLYDEESHKYTHRISALNGNTTFKIYNAGIAIHPFQQELKITVDEANGSNFTLLNQTTGDEFKYNESLSGKKLVLDGPNVTVNGLQAFRDTNRKFISLAKGWNEFKVSGALDARIAFDFPFYYL